MPRFVKTTDVIYVLVLLTVGHVFVQTQYSFKYALSNKSLRGHEFRNLTVKTVGECFLECVQDCLCLTFQICKNTVCQLLSSTRFQTPSSLTEMSWCSYYDMLPEQQHKESLTVSNFCHSGWSCCDDSNPCLNDGTCELVFPLTKYTKRFRCKCSPGYAGSRCEHPVVKSCRGYINGSRVAGKYKVFDAQMKLFEVFCDFDINSTVAWTMIQSYQLQNKIQFNYPFAQDKPVEEDNPVWDSYRLSKSRMESIRHDSGKWRITCRYDSDGLNYTDYVRVANDKIDILTYDGSKCMEVEYINIDGYDCTSCTAFISQQTRNRYTLHFDSYYTKLHCSLQPMGSLYCGGKGEDNFGAYGCVNRAHRCSASPTSTTQAWLGGD